MARRRKQGEYINCKLEQSIYDRFCEHAEKMGQSKTKALEIIIESYLDNFEKNDK